ncbi:MAG TPA: hypothetical protein VHW90_09600 [Stellaceae bacterium]|jgi:hypothetical protein|nr:hypothetical protein [Stellaceae bacterium]
MPAAGLRRSALAFLLMTLTAGTAAAQMVGGEYRVEGTNANGTHYAGSARIMPSSDTTCRITWHTLTDSAGICMIAGRAMCASYTLNGKIGLAMYQLLPDGSLHGVWTISDEPGSGTEILTPAK